MRHGADAGTADGVDQHPFLFRRVDQRRRVGDVGEQDVRLRGMPGKRNALRELSGALMVLGEPLQMMVERVHPRSGEHPCLPQPTSDALAQAPHRLHPLARGRHQRPRRRPQTLAQADRDRVRLRAPLLQRDPGRHVRVPDPCSVEMNGEAGGTRDVGDRLELRERPDAPAAAVLDGDRLLPGIVVALARADDLFHGLGGEDPARSVDDQALHAPQGRDGSALVVHDVAVPVADDLVAHPRERPQRDLVRHGAGGHPDSRFLAQHGGDAVLQRVDGRIFAIDVVADFRRRDRFSHAGCRAGHGVAAQVDEVHWMLRAEALRPSRAKPAPPGTGMINAPAVARESKAERPRRFALIVRRLEKEMPEAKIALEYQDELQLLVSVMLSAQCTDAVVNQVTPALFARYPTAAHYARSTPEVIGEQIKRVGLWRGKAKNLHETMTRIARDHGGHIPRKREELCELPGVGWKTAGVVVNHAFGTPALPVDTHVGRVSRRLGLTRQEDPRKVEHELSTLLPEQLWGRAHQLLIWHGRRTCEARRPHCSRCAVRDLCPRRGVTESD